MNGGEPRGILASPARKIGAAILAALVLFLWWNMVRRALAGPGSQYENFVAFARVLLFVRENLYETYPAWDTITKYPPFFAFVYAPLVALPVWLGASIWFWTSLACSAGAAIASALVVGASPEEVRRRPSTVWVPYLLIAGVVVSNLETGQVNLFLLFFWTVGLLFLERGRDGAAGTLVGYATAVKLTPGLFVAYFAWSRRWRAAIVAVLTVAVCWTLVMIVALGFDLDFYAEVMRDWIGTVTPFVAEGGTAEGARGFRHMNQSLSAAVHRYLTATPADGRELYVNIASLGLVTARRIVLILSAAVVILLAWLTRDVGRGGQAAVGTRDAAVGRRDAAGGPRDASRAGGDGEPDEEHALRCGFGYSLVMIATLFLSPVSWINHYVLLLFPYVAAWRYVATHPADDPGRRLLIGCLIVSAALVATAISRFLMAFSLPFLGAVVLFMGMAVVLRRDLAVASGPSVEILRA